MKLWLFNFDTSEHVYETKGNTFKKFSDVQDILFDYKCSLFISPREKHRLQELSVLDS
jgi:hypothetical protein